VDDRVGRIEGGVLEGGEGLGLGEVDALVKRFIEAFEVGGGVAHRPEEALAGAGRGPLERSEGGLDLLAVGGRRYPVAVVEEDE
jgi:hypothetical protein